MKLPPGGRGWPLIGDSIKWYKAVASSHPPRYVEDQVKRYGKIFTCNLFGGQAVVSADPHFNRFVMQNEGKLFKSCYPKSFRDLVGKSGVIVVQGEQQRKLHGIAVNMMKLEKLNSNPQFLGDVQMVMLQTLSTLRENQVVVLQDICRKLLGVSSESEVDEMACLFSDFVDGCLSVPINLPGFAYHTAMKARDTIIRKIKRMMQITRRKPRSAAGNGVLDRLVEEENLPGDVVADFIVNLLFAGNETTAKTMLFAIYFLTHCPKALEQLLVEQQNIGRMARKDMLEWEDYEAMQFTRCVVYETLRLGGIAIWLMREAKVDAEYQDFFIPKGSFVVPFLSAVHLDENTYPGALNFHPWRWMEQENKEKRNWRTSPFYTPFGGGARYCPGAELAHLQIAFFLHHFVTKYRDVGFFYRVVDGSRCRRLLVNVVATFMDEAVHAVLSHNEATYLPKFVNFDLLSYSALDSDDLLYLKEQMEAEEDAERLLRRTEKRAFAAFKISFSDSTPASLPLPLRVEPKPKSGIRQQDLLKNIVEIKPKRQRASSPSGLTQGDRWSPFLAARVSLSRDDEQTLEKCPSPAKGPTKNKSSFLADQVSTQRDTENLPGEDSSSWKSNGKETDAKSDNPVGSLLGLAYDSSDDE
ncbi:putative Abietadienol/abietadienal oxidase [Cocos nucifera]|uniref:Putative Abietadienol/abietadienal oxidase n=1 Tax=Cocos nucifera TaxID=13894 RepID=A0A8K0IGQ2_COCNU|nr:putative Abietadienol/abietadienal oxidase [Cocos nucifera]